MAYLPPTLRVAAVLTAWAVRVTLAASPSASPSEPPPWQQVWFPSVMTGLFSTIYPTPTVVIANVTILPDPGAGWLDASTTPSVRFHWTVMGGATQCSIELWQERYFYTGGDVLLYTVTPEPVAALAGAVSFQWDGIPLTLDSTSPVYFRVVAVAGPHAGVWGRSRTLNLLSKPLPGLADFLKQECVSDLAAGKPNAALCAQDCAACAAAGGYWATGSIAELTYSVDPAAPALPLPLGTIEFARLSATLGAFVQSTPVCVPASALEGGNSEPSSSGGGTQLALSLGSLPAVQAQLAALRPEDSVPTVLATLTVNAAATAATCNAVQPIVALVMSIATPIDNTPYADAALTTALADATNVPATSFAVKLRAQADPGAATSRRLLTEAHTSARGPQALGDMCV